MTRKYQKALFNGVVVKIKMMASTGRRAIGANVAPASRIEVNYSGPSFPEDHDQAQAEFDKFLKESADDLSREVVGRKGCLQFKTPKLPIYELPKPKIPTRETSESTLDADTKGTSTDHASNAGQSSEADRAPESAPHICSIPENSTVCEICGS